MNGNISRTKIEELKSEINLEKNNYEYALLHKKDFYTLKAIRQKIKELTENLNILIKSFST